MKQRVLVFLVLLHAVLGLNSYAKWEQLNRCKWVEHGSNDGDSFRVQTENGEVFQFRLYFVDTPEEGYFYPSRVQQQSRYFGINEAATMRMGHEATNFVREYLVDDTFTVYTDWKDAWGSQKRYAALVYKGDESLIELLVKKGLVRVHGFKPQKPWPGGVPSSTYHNLLMTLEKRAKSMKVGCWSGSENKGKDPESNAPLQFDKVDINHATIEQLVQLPGVGPVLANRILEKRPFSQVIELLHVHGIGERSFEKIRPLVEVQFRERPKKTAAFYLESPAEWDRREIELSISALNRPLKATPSEPDGFVLYSADTSSEGVVGGTIPLYLQENWANDAERYFQRSSGKPLLLKVRFFYYQGQWVTVFRKQK